MFFRAICLENNGHQEKKNIQAGGEENLGNKYRISPTLLFTSFREEKKPSKFQHNRSWKLKLGECA